MAGRLGPVGGLEVHREFGLDPAGVDTETLVADEIGGFEHGAVERQDAGHALDAELAQRAAGPPQRLLPRGAADDQLGEQRVESTGHDRTGLDPAVQAHARSAGRRETDDPARRGQVAASRVLGVDAEFDAMAAGRRRGVQGQGQAVGDAQLLDDQIQPRGFLGDRMLDLQARIDLEERDPPVARQQELHRARADIAGALANGPRGLVDARAPFIVEERRRSLLDQLLVAPLQRAVPVAQHQDLAVGVGHDLRLDVARPVQELLDEAFAAPERRRRLAHGGFVELGDLVYAPGDLQAPAAAAEGRLDGDRQPVGLGKGQCLGGRAHRSRRPLDQRGAGRLGDAPRRHLVAQGIDRRRRRTYPRQSGIDHGPREFRPLGQEAIAGMHRIGTRLVRDREQLADVQVGLGRPLALQGPGLVGQADMQALGIAVGVDGGRAHSVIGAGPDDAHGDFAPVGDQDFTYHGWISSNGPIGRKRKRAPTGICAARSSSWLARTPITG